MKTEKDIFTSKPFRIIIGIYGILNLLSAGYLLFVVIPEQKERNEEFNERYSNLLVASTTMIKINQTQP